MNINPSVSRWLSTSRSIDPTDPAPDPAPIDGAMPSDSDTGPTPPEPDPIDMPRDAVDGTPGAGSAEHFLEGPGIDPTGADVSTPAVIAWFAALPVGSTVVVRGGDIIALDATIIIDRRLDIRGGGELRFVAGISNAPALKITADGCAVRGIRIVDTAGGGIPTGGRNVGIEIHASDVTIDGVTVDGFQNGIMNTPFGEYGGVVVASCHVVNIVGAGEGSGSDSKYGEDRGDGITIWGSRATVTGNIVTAAAGTDARIGIHAEGLGDFAADPGSWPDAFISISGNIVTGPFRRSIALEAVGHASVVANTVSDATWWGIGAYGTRSATIVGNTVRWTRTAADTPGSIWGPVRCPIMIYRDARSTIVEANFIEIRGDASAAIFLYGARLEDSPEPVGPTDTIVSDNSVVFIDGSCPTGIAMAHAVRPIVSGNRLAVSAGTGAVGGVMSYYCVDVMLIGNSITGGSSESGHGIHHQGPGPVVFNGNRIDRVRVGLSAIHCTDGAMILANTVRDCEYGLDTFGSTGRSVVQGNRWESKNTAHANAQPNTTYLSTRHMGLAKPYGGASGDLLVGNGKLWVNDQGTWRSAALT